jgi:1,2-diacylglycerol 3-alpha-glucosyltransferase
MIIGEFVDTYPPCVDGVGRVTYSYCQMLKSMGHEPYYIAPNAPDGEEVCDVPMLLQKSLPLPGEAYRLALPKLDVRYRLKLDAIPFDIVHTHSPFSAGEEALRISRKLDVPLVTTFHSKYYQDFYDKTHSELIAKEVVRHIVRFYNKCDSVWTVNNATAQVLEDYGYHGKILVMENGTDPVEPDPKDAEEARRRFCKEGVPVFLFVGQHNYKKNLHGVLGSMAILRKQGQPFHLVTAGNGPDFDAIVQEAKDLGIADACTFEGFVSDRSKLMSLYRCADLLVFPSVYDNAPMVLREAATMSTPGVLVKGSCAAEGVTDEVNGFICEDESPEAIAKTILRALPQLKAVGEKARQTIPVHWMDIMPQVVAEYERLIGERKSSPAKQEEDA